MSRKEALLMRLSLGGAALWLFVILLPFFGLLQAVSGVFSAVSVLFLSLFFAIPVVVKKKASFLEIFSSDAGGLCSLLIFGLALGLALPTGELIPGGWDPGVYLQTGVQISKQGGLLFSHQDLLEVSPEAHEILYRDVYEITEVFGGMRLDPEGRVTPQFYHAYPSLLAVVYGLTSSVRAMLMVNPVLHALAAVILFQWMRFRTGSLPWAGAGTLFFLWIPTQLWQAKFCTAEPLTLLFLLSGWWMLDRWSCLPVTRWFEALLAGFCLGLAVLTRYDSIMVWMILLPVLGATLGFPGYRKGVGGILLGASPCLILWFMHQRVAPYYAPLGSMVNVLVWACLGITLLAALVCTFFPVARWWAAGRIWVLGAATVGWWTVMGFLWRIRPYISSRGEFAQGLVEKGFESFAAGLTSPAKVSLWYLESNFGFVGLLLILLLVPVLWWKAAHPARFAWALAGAGIWLVLSWDPFNDLFMMWVSRRFVPMVIPWIVVGLVTGLVWMQTQTLGRGKILQWIPVGLMAIMFVLPVKNSWFQLRNRDWPGATQWFENTADLVPPDAVLLTDQPGFGSPFRFIWGKQAFELRRQRPELLRRFLDLHAQDPFAEDLWILTTSEMLKAEPGWKAVVEVPLRTTMQATHQYRIPRALKPRGGDFVLYHWVGEDG